MQGAAALTPQARLSHPGGRSIQSIDAMHTVEAHPHSFSASDWPFSDPANAVAFTTNRVLRGGLPILRVSHDWDGDWQFLCGTTNAIEDALVVCLGCAFERDRTIGELADLPIGWGAWRDGPGAPWERSRNDPELVA